MKKIYISAIMLIVAMSGCSQDEPYFDAGSSDAEDLFTISVLTGKTKGADVTTDHLEDSESGVKLHIDDDDSILGPYDFKASDSDWSQSSGTQLKWSDIKFPASFYSVHDGTTSKSLTMSEGSASVDHTVSGASSSHVDLVYHTSTLSAVPAGSVLYVYHKHALSKINLYVSTGTNKLYLARVQLVNVDSDGKLTISPVSAADLSTSTGVSWGNGSVTEATYEYYYVGDDKSPTSVSTSTSSVIITDNAAAPLMVIPQTTTAATSEQIATADGEIDNTYIEVIYYMTDSADNPLVGYSSVSQRSDAYKYKDQTSTLYVMAAFPLGYTFAENKQYDITLGLGATDTTGGILIYDYYVNKKGEKITLTETDGTTTTTPDVPGLEPGDEILGSSSDYFDIIVTVEDWDDGEDTSAN